MMFCDRSQIKILVLSFSVWIFLNYITVFSFFFFLEKGREKETVRQEERQRKR